MDIADLGGRNRLALGLDAGSVSFKYAICDADTGQLLAGHYQRHLGRPVEVAHATLGKLFDAVPPDRFVTVAGTGTSGRLICELLGVPFVNELICQAVAVKRAAPQVRTVIEMGGQDSKMLFLPAGDGHGGPIVDFAMNTNCAAGTGSFLDQQASRLGIDIENEFGDLALRSQNPPRVAGRCSVFAKSDMIHLQQLATPDYDIVAGLCLGLARNLKSNLARGHEVVRPIGFVGGVAANAGVVRMLERVFELAEGELTVPDCHATTGAWGAALVRLRANGSAKIALRPLPDRRTEEDLDTEEQCPEALKVDHDLEAKLAADADHPADARPAVAIDLTRLADYLQRERTVGHRLEALGNPSRPEPDSRVVLDERLAEPDRGTKIDAYLGLDVGSISTKIAVIDADNRVLGTCYLMTAGRPLEAVRQCLAEVGRQVGNRVRIRGAATTGSGRYLTGDFIGADMVINEITAQAHAAALIDPQVDTIFEIGGQDSKYISLDGGVVVDFEMNHACAAGTGSFLEEQAERLGISIKGDFARLASAAGAPIKLGERCTVFMESDLLSYQQQGADTEDLVSGLAYSIVGNYINRVVGQRRIGERIFFQGGTAFNRAVVAAFEKVTGRPITVPPHHEVTGAIGAAALARKFQADNERDESNFRGFDLSDIEYEVRSFECTACSNNCEINEVTIAGREPLYYGSRCDRYNVTKERDNKSGLPNLFVERNRLLRDHSRVERKPAGKRPTVGIPLALSNYQLLPFWSTLLDELGADVIVSPPSSRRVVHEGVEAVATTPCFPVKVAHGHVLELIRKGVDNVFLPSIVSMPDEYPEPQRNHLCPYVQTLPYQVAVALEHELEPVKLLKPVVRFQEGRRVLLDCLRPVAREFGASAAQLKRALAAAEKAQIEFEDACRARGREVLDNLDPDTRTVVVVGRPYNTSDAGISLDLPNKLRRLGVQALPMDFLDLGASDMGEDRLFSNMFWKYGQKILRAGKIIREHPHLHAIYLSNFSCGPDSFVISFFKRIMGPKPSLVLEIDEHSADAGAVTRLEAFLESLANSRPLPAESLHYQPVYKRNGRTDASQRTVYIPWMGDASFALAAAFRGQGQASEVLPLADAKSLELGRRQSTGKECLPCIVTAGDMLKKCNEPGFESDRAAFLMPGGTGPCRFGQYNCLHKIMLMESGFGNVPVIAPNQDRQLYHDFSELGDPTRAAWCGIAALDVMFKTLLATRPYEVNAGQTDRIYEAWRNKVCDALSDGASEATVESLMHAAADAFRAIPTDRSRPRPRIGILGEIYVRSHTFSNNDLIRHLEAMGAQTQLASFAEWMYYTNLTRQRAGWRERGWRDWATNLLKDKVQRRIHERLARPFAGMAPDVIEPPVQDVLDAAAPYIHDSFEGEAVLSVGKMVEYCHSGCHGVANVMPFTCMPSTIVAGLTKRIVADLGGMPILSVSYDGQQDPTLQTRLEAFVFQATAFMDAHAKDAHAGRENAPAHV